MPPDETEPSEERTQTDESLRLERERADETVREQSGHVDATADAVITRARALADKVLSEARAKTDRGTSTGTRPSIVAKERRVEDQALLEERSSADEAVRQERAEHASLLAAERESTDQDLLSERIQSDDAVAARDEFLSIVSHDLRNMLNSVVGYAELIETRISQDPHLEDVFLHAQRIQRSGARMNRLIGDLVDVASIEAGMLAVTREVGDPVDVVREAVDTFQAQASAAGISLVTEVVPPTALAAFDASRLLQVLTNLLSNAMKFTPRDGKVVVRVETIEDEFRCTVSDTGTGIPEAMLKAVFERFLQVAKNDRRGLGLGLFISKCIVQGHGGRIWAENRIGGGSSVSFTLPVHVPA